MGFFDSFIQKNFDLKVAKYSQMDSSQLKETWNRFFDNWISSLEENELTTIEDIWNMEHNISGFRKAYKDKEAYGDDMIACDKAYAQKISSLGLGEKSFLEIVNDYETRLQKIKQDAIKEYEQAQKAEQEKVEALERFKNTLPQNDMVFEILSSINAIGYDVAQIRVFSHSLISHNFDNNKNYEIKYKKYGYPNLDADQISVLAHYLAEKLDLDFEVKKDDYSDDYWIFLNDAPGGMKSSW